MMLLIIMTIIIYGLVIIYDYFPFRKIQSKIKNGIYLSLLGLSFIFLILVIIDVKMPSPTKLIIFLLRSIIRI